MSGISKKLKLLNWVAIGFAIVGFICMLYFIFTISKYYLISRFDGSSSIDMQVTGQVGDFIGGVVGTLWAFSTVIFLYVSLKIQGDEISKQNIRWETQRIEDIYFKLIENYNSITFLQPPGERARPLYNLAVGIKEVLIRKNSIEEYKQSIKEEIFFPYQDGAVWRISESLFFIIKFLYKSGREGDLINHLAATLPVYEKSLLFYYLLANSNKFNDLPREKYLKSGLVQDADIPYDVLRAFAPDLFAPLNLEDHTLIVRPGK